MVRHVAPAEAYSRLLTMLSVDCIKASWYARRENDFMKRVPIGVITRINAAIITADKKNGIDFPRGTMIIGSLVNLN